MFRIAEWSPSASLDRCLRRVHPKYVVSAYNPAYTAFVGISLMLIGNYLASSLSICSLSASALSLTMLVSLLFKMTGNALPRRNAKEQAHWICSVLIADPLCDTIELFRCRYWRYGGVALALLGAETGLGSFLSMGRLLILVGGCLIALAVVKSRCCASTKS